VKEAVFPVHKFHGIDIVLGPEMKIDRRSDGHRREPGIAYAKAQMAAQPPLPLRATSSFPWPMPTSRRWPTCARFCRTRLHLYATSGPPRA
jgi:carbamoyl-phosphate synthase large subunit